MYPKLTRYNPAREDPVWFESLRPAARTGARLLASFSRRPHHGEISPIIVLQLLSTRFDAIRFAHKPVASQCLFDQFVARWLAELFVPGFSERTNHDLIPEPLTTNKPVRLVTARTILLPGMANLLRDRRRAVELIQSASAYVDQRSFHPLLSRMRATMGGH